MNICTLRLNGAWKSIFDPDGRAQLEAILPAWLNNRRWFAGKARTQRSVTIADAIRIPTNTGCAFLALVRVEYTEGEAGLCVLPLALATGTEAARVESEFPTLILARTDGAGEETPGVLHDATCSAAFARALLDAIIHRRSFSGASSRIECLPTSALKDRDIRADTPLAPRLSTSEQSNTAIRFGDRLLLKLFRNPAAGINPDLEIGRVLTARRFPNTPPLLGAVECHGTNGEERTLGVLHGFVAGAIDGWEYTLDEFDRFCERVGSREPLHEPGPLLGPYVESVRLLGQRTAEMHLALAAVRGNPAFAPEPFTTDCRRELHQSMRALTLQNLHLLKGKLDTLDGESRKLAAAVIAAEPGIIARFDRIDRMSFTGLRIRVHGDYHLGQTLCMGRDFFIVDFEGEPSLPLSARQTKRTPFHDVAGLLRSFDYAANAALRRGIERGAISAASLPRFAAWADRWTRWISAACLESYLSHIGNSDILPASAAERALLLDAHLLRKAVYELGYELNNRPDWLPIPCRGILALLGDDHSGTSTG